MQATPMPPQGQSPAQQPPQQQGGGAEQAIQMIQKGFETISKMMEAAQGQVDPQDVKLFQMAVKATDDFIQSITGSADDEAAEQEAPKHASQPMPQNANAGAKPAPQY